MAVTLGPLTFPVAVLALLLGCIVALAVAGFMRRRGHGDAGNALYLALAAALVAARITYVVQWWPQYMKQPLAMLNVRDGGFTLAAGLAVLLLAALLTGWRRPPLRVGLATGVVAGLSVWALTGLTAERLTLGAQPALPTMTLESMDGANVALDTLKGQPLVINFWATWCAPCRREMPVLAEAQSQRTDVRFVFANQGESAASVRTYLDNEALQLDHVLLDAGMDLSRHYHVRGYPTTLFLDAKGQLRDTHVGELSRASLAEKLQRIAPAPPPNHGFSP